jgi:[glutamine synthetase] adenylyltransferase / [glutamine synthetase]-adenylyl-L-tyrosine phosphorylase
VNFRASQFSSYFKRNLDAGWLEVSFLHALCEQPLGADDIQKLLARYSLRRTRCLVLMTLMERDLRGAASLDEVCRTMTSLAEIACALCFRRAAEELRERFGTPLDQQGQAQDLLVIAMGKAGAYELNVSSDLDIILVFRDQGETSPAPGSTGRSISSSEFFHLVARKAIGDLSELREDGFVFRIDTRLRPNGDSGPLVLSLAMLEHYFLVQGREWERFAWLKSRVIADTGVQAWQGGNSQTEQRELRAIVDPFVFRRYVDYRVFDGLKGLHQLIRSEALKKDLKAPGTVDVKLGDGGIREIEFTAQMFQIVRGGRDSGLRNPATLPTLKALAERGLISLDEAQGLSAAYVLLRRTEHALQYIDDQQTHRLASPGEERERIATMLGLGDQFDAELDQSRQLVKRVFGGLLGFDSAEKVAAVAADAPPALPALSDETRSRLDAFQNSSRYRSASAETQQAWLLLFERAQRALTEPESAQDTLIRLVDFAEVVCRRPSYIALLARFPLAFERLLVMLGRSSWAAAYLNKHPIVLDELLDGRVFDAPDLAAWQRQTLNDLGHVPPALDQPDAKGTAAPAPDIERQMDLARESHHALIFKLLAQDLNGQWTVEALSDQLSEAADRMLQTAIDCCWQNLPKRFRPQPQFAAIAYGKLGGKELGYASDLDLVFIHDDPDPRAQEAYAQLAQRISSWLSTRTQAGIVFEIDLRLRPNGNAGLLVSSLEGFERYQRERAWTWELQALTRSRASAGEATLGARSRGAQKRRAHDASKNARWSPQP